MNNGYSATSTDNRIFRIDDTASASNARVFIGAALAFFSPIYYGFNRAEQASREAQFLRSVRTASWEPKDPTKLQRYGAKTIAAEYNVQHRRTLELRPLHPV